MQAKALSPVIPIGVFPPSVISPNPSIWVRTTKRRRRRRRRRRSCSSGRSDSIMRVFLLHKLPKLATPYHLYHYHHHYSSLILSTHLPTWKEEKEDDDMRIADW